MSGDPQITLLGSLLIEQGLSGWMPEFQERPTPRYAAAVLGMPREAAERIDRLEFDGQYASARWELEQWRQRKRG